MVLLLNYYLCGWFTVNPPLLVNNFKMDGGVNELELTHYK